MKTRIFLVGVLAALPAFGQDGQPAKPALPDKPIQRYMVQSKSTFSIQEGIRVPFIPVGWVKPLAGAGPLVKAPSADEGMFRVSSILIGSPTLAVINGRTYEEGQMIRIPKGSPQVRAKVYRITDGKVLLQLDNEFMTVRLRRGELNQKTQPEELLNSERE